MIYRINPYFIDKIWGGQYYVKLYKVNQIRIGEVVLFSTHSDFELKLLSSDQKKFLKEVDVSLYKKINYLYPLTIKFIDAKDDLSIQLHPDNQFANKNHQTLGKEEYWIILDVSPSSSISIGHSITDKNFLRKTILKGNLSKYMNHHPISAYDTFYVPTNTVHAIRKNTRLLEIAQASILNFRIDDYKRKDKNGQFRKLHIKEALEVIEISDQNVIKSFPSHLFTYQIYDIQNRIVIKLNKEISILIVLEGDGQINSYKLSEGQTFVLYKEKILQLDGTCKIIIIESSLE